METAYSRKTMLHAIEFNVSTVNLMLSKQYFTTLPFYGTNILRFYSRKVPVVKQKKTTSGYCIKPRLKKVLNYFAEQPHLNDVKPLIPSQYLIPNQKSSLQYLYLIDKKIAKDAVSHILQHLLKKPGIICETNAGLGLITSELLSEGIEFVRLYESCSEFREVLKQQICKTYPKRVRLYDKDLFHLSSLSYADRVYYGNRVDGLLKGVPRKKWKDDPVMTIIGPMPAVSFINYLLRTVVYQSEIITYGRIQLFAFMKSKHYLTLTSNAGDSLKKYKTSSVLFQLFFDWELLEKYPSQSFLPWDMQKRTRLESDYMYLVHISFKKTLPTKVSLLLHLYYFIKQGFGSRKSKVIPTVEKWFPGIGIDLIVPSKKSINSFKDMNIYTEFGELSPLEILQVFHKIVTHPDFKTSSFMALVDSLVMKTETITENDKGKRK